MARKRNKEKLKKEFIRKARLVHGNKYDYSLVEYVNSKIKVKIVCGKHGVFEQYPNHHVRGIGCRYCSYEELSKKNEGKRRKPLWKFIEESRSIHGDRYDYSLVEYKNNKSKIKLICKKCNRVFEVYLHNHLSLRQKQGCPYCYGNKKRDKNYFIDKARSVHGDKYDYSLVEYKNIDTKVKILCKRCNKVFEQLPRNHLYHRNGCPYCSRKRKKDLTI